MGGNAPGHRCPASREGKGTRRLGPFGKGERRFGQEPHRDLAFGAHHGVRQVQANPRRAADDLLGGAQEGNHRLLGPPGTALEQHGRAAAGQRRQQAGLQGGEVEQWNPGRYGLPRGPAVLGILGSDAGELAGQAADRARARDHQGHAVDAGGVEDVLDRACVGGGEDQQEEPHG